MNIFTFWEGPIPDYIRLCMDTWKVQYTILDYGNLSEYTDLKIKQLQRFTLPQIADCVRVHVLRDSGGYWLDADTIMLADKMPDAMMIGNPALRTQSIGYLYARERGMALFTEWAAYQDSVLDDPNASHHWSVMGNMFTDRYVKQHNEVTICPIKMCLPETYLIRDDAERYYKYLRFYFNSAYRLDDIEPTNILMLHNSWTPQWYKELSADAVLKQGCTLSNILREVL